MVEHTFDLIDVHQPIECGVGLQGALDFGGKDAGGQGGPDLEFRKRMAAMDELRMRGAIVIAGNMYLRPNGLDLSHEDQSAILGGIAKRILGLQ